MEIYSSYHFFLTNLVCALTLFKINNIEVSEEKLLDYIKENDEIKEKALSFPMHAPSNEELSEEEQEFQIRLSNIIKDYHIGEMKKSENYTINLAPNHGDGHDIQIRDFLEEHFFDLFNDRYQTGVVVSVALQQMQNMLNRLSELQQNEDPLQQILRKLGKD